ncbi:hypothetical protein M885DRAFT_574277 [Pelagophyceae sp. CCMP2097]|nr:hypothetical protein M885DRAFT_574277 [Pelagophyceae sp. CCMP2097]
MAFRTSAVRLGGAVKAGVSEHLQIWWSKKPRPGVTDGMVIQTISPFELKPMRSLYDQYGPQNFLNNFPNLIDIGPAFVALVGAYYGSDWYFDYLV